MSAPPAVQVGVGKLKAGVGNLGLLERPVGKPSPDEVLVAVIAAGICGTDLHIIDDEFPSQPPVIMGHEVTGTVAVVGDRVDAEWLGSRVAVETYFSYCERCAHCRAGRPNLCDRRRSIGSAVDGGFAPWLLVPARNLHRLPDQVGRDAGALTEPLACVTNLLFDPGVVGVGDRVLVTGPGTMGILTAQAARAAGGEVVLAGLARDRGRLEVAALLGLATHDLDNDGDLNGPFDVVCEASGAAPAAALGVAVLARRGHYVQVGIFGSTIEFDLDALLYKEAVLTSGNATTPTSWRRAITLLEQGRIQLEPLVTHRLAIDDWERAFAATRAGEGVKVVLAPEMDQE